MSGKSRKATARRPETQQPAIDEFRGQHLAVAQRQIATEHGHASVTIDDAESPLAWLARRRGRMKEAANMRRPLPVKLNVPYCFTPSTATTLYCA
jgi:hypothetical protein